MTQTNEEETVVMAFRVPLSLREKVEEIARAEDRPVSWIIRRALVRAVEQSKQAQPAQEA